MKTAIAIRHVHFEDLGTLEPLLRRRGYKIHYSNVAVQELDALELDKADLLVVLGAPIGACGESRPLSDAGTQADRTAARPS